MLDDIRHAAARQRTARAVRRMKADCKRLLGEKGELGGMAITADLIERLDSLADEELEEFFDYLASDLSPDPQQVLRLAQAYRRDQAALCSSPVWLRRPCSGERGSARTGS